MAFEFDGEKYSKASAHQKEWGSKLIAEFNFRGDEQILDLGCGDGMLTTQLADSVPNGHVIGIDASQGMINTARKHRRNNLEFILMNIDSLSFETEFDLVFSNATLHWIKDHKNLLKNVSKVLKANGIIRFNFAADGNCSNFFRIIKNVMKQPEYAVYFRDFTWPWFLPDIDSYQTLINDFTFTDVKVWETNADRYFPNQEAMIRWIDQPSIVPLLKYVDDGDKENFRNAVVKKMINATLQADGTCFETFRRINIYATK